MGATTKNTAVIVVDSETVDALRTLVESADSTLSATDDTVRSLAWQAAVRVARKVNSEEWSDASGRACVDAIRSALTDRCATIGAKAIGLGSDGACRTVVTLCRLIGTDAVESLATSSSLAPTTVYNRFHKGIGHDTIGADVLSALTDDDVDTAATLTQSVTPGPTMETDDETDETAETADETAETDETTADPGETRTDTVESASAPDPLERFRSIVRTMVADGDVKSLEVMAAELVEAIDDASANAAAMAAAAVDEEPPVRTRKRARGQAVK